MSSNLYIVTLDFNRTCEEVAAELRDLAEVFEAGGDSVAHEATEAARLEVRLMRLSFLAEMAGRLKPDPRLH
jgi:hypothetical protein